jgi:hypothetical protein
MNMIKDIGLGHRTQQKEAQSHFDRPIENIKLDPNRTNEAPMIPE